VDFWHILSKMFRWCIEHYELFGNKLCAERVVIQEDEAYMS
jgi:hypothetical protein